MRAPRAVAAVTAALVCGVPAAAGAAVDPGDATVVAVIDSALNPYHVDFGPVEGLPTDRPPHEWLSGFPSPDSFAGYEKLRLTPGADEQTPVADLHDSDLEKWNGVTRSTRGAAHYRWLPGTKVVGLLDFAGNRGYGSLGAHGTRAASVAVGRRHGTCPDCLLVFLSYATPADGEAAIEWALEQPWIDVITNSYGFSAVQRDRLYSGSDTEAQRRASERGQTIFFSAGNGQNNDYMVPNTTLFSSQEGPDWTITVGGVASDGSNWTGTGKPADVAGPSRAIRVREARRSAGPARSAGRRTPPPCSPGPSPARSAWRAPRSPDRRASRSTVAWRRGRRRWPAGRGAPPASWGTGC